MFRISATIISLVLFYLSVSGCSSQDSPITSGNTHPDVIQPLTGTDYTDTNHDMLGAWSIHFDIENLAASVEPVRSVNVHYNVTSMLPPLSLVINDYNPATSVFDVDVTITNPFPINVYDVRLIIYTDDIGHVLLDPDGWTNLYDKPGGLIINPFKAYAKSESNRIFAGLAQHSENLQIYLPGGNPVVLFAVDASYPANCDEPYEISGFTQNVLYDTENSSAWCEVTVLDWQSDVDEVQLYCPAITGVPLVSFTQINTETWVLEIHNAADASTGDHTGYLMATSSNSPIALYNGITIVVDHDPESGWAGTWGGDNHDIAWDIAISSDGYVYVVGNFIGIVDFDPGPGEVIKESNNPESAFLSRFDCEGNFQDVKVWGDGANEIIASRVALDTYGNVWVAGLFRSDVEVDFDPGDGVVLKSTFGGWDIFLEKFSPEGDCLWVESWGSISNDRPESLVTDGDSNVYFVGKCEAYGSTLDFGLVFCKLDNSGNLDWVKAWAKSSCNDSECFGISIGENDHFFITGTYSGPCDFDPDLPLTWPSNDGSQDAYLVEYDSDGKFQEVKTWGGTSRDSGEGISTDGSGNVYVSGFFESESVDFDPGSAEVILHPDGDGDLYISKFDSSVDFEWVRSWGGSSHGYGWVNLEQNMFVCADYEDSVCVTGYFEGTGDFDPTENGVYEIESAGVRDIFIIRLDSEGGWEWSRTWGSTPQDRGLSLAYDLSNNIYTCGFYSSIIDFDPGDDIDEHTSNGSLDAYLMKLQPNGYWE